MDTCCCYFLATVDNSEDHRSANVHLKPCASIHAVGLLECMSVLSLTVSAAGVRSPQLRVPVHLRTGLWFPNHHHLLVLVPPPPVVVITVLVSVKCPSTTAPVGAVAGAWHAYVTAVGRWRRRTVRGSRPSLATQSLQREPGLQLKDWKP